MAENLKSRHAFGAEANIDSALDQGLIDAYDILFLNEGKIGWIDKDGNKVILEDKKQIVRVEELPIENGDEDVVYIYNNESYIWDGTQCISLSKSADLTSLETQVAELEEQMNTKVDATTVQNMIQKYSDSSSEVVEF